MQGVHKRLHLEKHMQGSPQVTSLGAGIHEANGRKRSSSKHCVSKECVQQLVATPTAHKPNMPQELHQELSRSPQRRKGGTQEIAAGKGAQPSTVSLTQTPYASSNRQPRRVDVPESIEIIHKNMRDRP